MKCCGSSLAAIPFSAVAIVPSLGGNSIWFTIMRSSMLTVSSFVIGFRPRFLPVSHRASLESSHSSVPSFLVAQLLSMVPCSCHAP
jgi:hypothetical protein